jgi:single-strand DNA-binding protein
MASHRNELTIEGNLTRDPELRVTQRGMSVCNFSIASNRFRKVGGEFEKETSFFDIQCWNDTADYVYNNVHKGTPVEVKGRLKQDSWADRNGQNKSKVIIVAESVYIQQRKQYSNPQGNQTEGCPF